MCALILTNCAAIAVSNVRLEDIFYSEKEGEGNSIVIAVAPVPRTTEALTCIRSALKLLLGVSRYLTASEEPQE